MTKTGFLQGREVEIREVMYGVLLDNQDKTPFEQTLAILVHSAYWADTGERVFASRQALATEWPLRLWREINDLATLSNALNMDATPDAATTNGTAEAGAPFLLTPERLFLHRLALALGRTVGEIERGMSVRELDNWRRFCSAYPLPAELIDIHAARQLAMLANVNRGTDTPPFDWRDFLLLRDRPAEPEKPRLTMAQKMKAVVNG